MQVTTVLFASDEQRESDTVYAAGWNCKIFVWEDQDEDVVRAPVYLAVCLTGCLGEDRDKSVGQSTSWGMSQQLSDVTPHTLCNLATVHNFLPVV